jgi:hypothetical protein
MSEGVPSGTRYWIVMSAIVLLVAAQLAIPLRYYAGGDPYDERFSWRMFSEVRVVSCDPSATETKEGATAPVDLGRELHEAWTGLLSRNREAVIERFLEHRCEGGASAATFTNRCHDARYPVCTRDARMRQAGCADLSQAEQVRCMSQVSVMLEQCETDTRLPDLTWSIACDDRTISAPDEAALHAVRTPPSDDAEVDAAPPEDEER